MIDIQNNAGAIFQAFCLGKALGAFFGNAPEMRGHSQKVLHLRAFYRAGKCKPLGFQQGKAGESRCGFLFFLNGSRINDAFQPQ